MCQPESCVNMHFVVLTLKLCHVLSDEEPQVDSRPRTASGKKVPKGGVSIFGGEFSRLVCC